MGFVIDMISGEIQDISKPATNRLETSDKVKREDFEIIDRAPRIQEYLPIEKTPVLPESIRHIDIDTFLERM